MLLIRKGPLGPNLPSLAVASCLGLEVEREKVQTGRWDLFLFGSSSEFFDFMGGEGAVLVWVKP